MLHKNFVLFSILLTLSLTVQAKTNQESAFSTIGSISNFNRRSISGGNSTVVKPGFLIRVRQSNEEFNSAEAAISAIIQDVLYLLPFLERELPKFPEKDCSQSYEELHKTTVTPAVYISDPHSFSNDDFGDWNEAISTSDFEIHGQPSFHSSGILYNENISGPSTTIGQNIQKDLRFSFPKGFKGKLNYVLKFERYSLVNLLDSPYEKLDHASGVRLKKKRTRHDYLKYTARTRVGKNEDAKGLHKAPG